MGSNNRRIKLTAAARGALRKALRAAPGVERHISARADIGHLRKEELITLGERVGIDVTSIIRSAGGIVFDSLEESLEYARQRFAKPAFSGILHFDLEWKVMGAQFSRKARVTWSNTPEWDYFDPDKGKVVAGIWNCVLEFEVEALPEGYDFEIVAEGAHRKRRRSPEWLAVNLLDDGIFPTIVTNEIERRIDNACRAQDKSRRQEAAAKAREIRSKSRTGS